MAGEEIRVKAVPFLKLDLRRQFSGSMSVRASWSYAATSGFSILGVGWSKSQDQSSHKTSELVVAEVDQRSLTIYMTEVEIPGQGRKIFAPPEDVSELIVDALWKHDQLGAEVLDTVTRSLQRAIM